MDVLNDSRFVYIAVTDCLPLRYKDGLLVRPIKVGKTKCLCDRDETWNRGAITKLTYVSCLCSRKTIQDLQPEQRSLPLLGCPKWKLVFATARLSVSEAQLLEQAVLDLLDSRSSCSKDEKWPLENLRENVGAAIKHRKSSEIDTNGVDEIRLMNSDLSAEDSDVSALGRLVQDFVEQLQKVLREPPSDFTYECGSCEPTIKGHIPYQDIECAGVLFEFDQWKPVELCNRKPCFTR